MFGHEPKGPSPDSAGSVEGERGLGMVCVKDAIPDTVLRDQLDSLLRAAGIPLARGIDASALSRSFGRLQAQLGRLMEYPVGESCPSPKAPRRWHG